MDPTLVPGTRFESQFQICVYEHAILRIYIIIIPTTYTPAFPKSFFFLTKFSLPSSLSFMRLFCKQLSSSESFDYVPLRRNEVRSILGDDCLLSSVLIEGQIRLKDTTLFRWARINILIVCLYCCFQVCFLDILVFVSSIRTSPTTILRRICFFRFFSY